MLFGSAVFLFLFLPVVLLLHRLSPRAVRNGLLLVASLLFYAWGEPRFVLVMIALLAGDYFLGRLVDARRGRAGGRAALGLAIAFNLVPLAFYKYAGFLWDNLRAVVGEWLPELDPIPLPIGISFFTFQAMSYLVDVYRRDAPVQRNPIDFALYVSMFPQLIAGPIVRYRDVAAQLARRLVTRDGFAYGVRRFVIGLGKKLLVADVVGRTADEIFGLESGALSTGTAWLGAICYTFQIYYDFSAYSDMAIGLGRMLGFRFRENFDYPYASRSVTEFWRRWHISLSSWFRDYLYVPLGGNRSGRARTLRNLVIVFFLCGLWHGAAWTFVVWGLYHGALLVIERVGLHAQVERLPSILRRAYVLLAVVVGWVLFRSETFAGALAHLQAMFAPTAGAPVYAPGLYLDPLLTTVLVVAAVGSAPLWPAVARWRERLVARGAGAADGLLELAQVAVLGAVLLASLLQLSAGTYSPFIYFRF